MDDAYLYFTAETGDAITLAARNLSKSIHAHQITELGKGHQKFVEIWSDGGFTSNDKETTIELLTGETTPGATVLQTLLNTTGALLSVEGLKAKIPLPSVGLDDFITLNFTGTEMTAATSAAIMARIVLNP